MLDPDFLLSRARSVWCQGRSLDNRLRNSLAPGPVAPVTNGQNERRPSSHPLPGNRAARSFFTIRPVIAVATLVFCFIFFVGAITVVGWVLP